MRPRGPGGRAAGVDEGGLVKIEGAVAFVTGANRGLGRAFARILVERGAARVYGAARDPGTLDEAGVVPVALDVTDSARVEAVARAHGDVTLLVNNAGVMAKQPLIGAPDLDAAREEMEVNYFGTLAMCRAFAPVLAANGGGALVNMLSVVSWFTPPASGSYGVSKAAEWAMTNGIRIELAPQGTLVVGVHSSFIDTDMAAEVEAPKADPVEVARQVFDAVEDGRTEVTCDELCREIKSALPQDQELIYPEIQAAWNRTVSA